MKSLFAALLAMTILSISAAQGAEQVQREKKPAATRVQKPPMKTAQRIEGLKKYLAEKASQTAAIIRVNAQKFRSTVWPERRGAEKSYKGIPNDAKGQPAKADPFAKADASAKADPPAKADASATSE